MSPVSWFNSYPAYERVLIVDLNKDTKMTINKVPTGSNPELSQEQPTKTGASAFGYISPLFFQLSRIYRSLSHATYKI